MEVLHRIKRLAGSHWQLAASVLTGLGRNRKEGFTTNRRWPCDVNPVHRKYRTDEPHRACIGSSTGNPRCANRRHWQQATSDTQTTRATRPPTERTDARTVEPARPPIPSSLVSSFQSLVSRLGYAALGGLDGHQAVPGVVNIPKRPVVDHVPGVVVGRGGGGPAPGLVPNHVVARVVDVVGVQYGFFGGECATNMT